MQRRSEGSPERAAVVAVVVLAGALAFACGPIGEEGDAEPPRTIPLAGAGGGAGAGAGGSSGSATGGRAGSGASGGSAGQAGPVTVESVPPGPSAEDSGGGCELPELPTYAALTDEPKLNDPFLSLDGTRIAAKDDWTCRRAEIGAQAAAYELGEKPRRPVLVSGSFADGAVTVTAGDDARSVTFTATITLPSTGTAPYPAIIGIGASSLNNAALAARGIATIRFDNDDVAAQMNASSRGSGKFYDLYGRNHSAGALMAWSWGVSRLIDALEMTPEAEIDATHLGVTGCSRNGKGALVAGAFDERIALTIPQESGSGGSAAWRVSDAQSAMGEVVQTLSQITTENCWFRSQFSAFGSTATRLPFDHHMILGMVAPRGLLVIENTSQIWLGNQSTFTASLAAHEIWEAHGDPDGMSFSQVGNHDHCRFPASQQPLVDAYVDRYLLGDDAAIEGVLETDGAFTLDEERWIGWETPRLE